MSRRLNATARGRQAQSLSASSPQLKLTLGGKTGFKKGARNPKVASSSRKRRAAAYIEDDSTTSGEASGQDDFDEESDEADDESDEPEASALLHSPSLRGGAGPNISDVESDKMSDPGEWSGFPEMPDQEPLEWDKQMNAKLFDSDDDLEYEKVNEVSDMEDEVPENRFDNGITPADFDEDMASHFANQIDGMSAYGFGDTSDDEEGSILFNWSSGDELNDLHKRHVRFEEPMTLTEQRKVGMPNAFNVFGHAPAMTRALLPSALPEKPENPETVGEDQEDDGFDSDATEELERPAEAWKLLPAQRRTPPEPSPPAPRPRRLPGQKGPVRGTFEDDGEKVSAILDSTGRKLLLQDPHLLGGVFARKYAPSLPASPSNSFTSAVLDETDSSASVGVESPRLQNALPQPTIDLMLSALNSGENMTTNGQASGLPEAFMPADHVFLQDFVTHEAMGLAQDDGDGPDGKLRLEDMIVFDSNNEEDSNPESPLPPSFLPESFSAPSTPLPHLTSMNVTAFKRMAEPQSYFDTARPSPLKTRFTTPLKRKKRSDRYDSPYNDRHYKGVTPVQRITYHEHSSSPAPPSTVQTHKRRKTMF